MPQLPGHSVLKVRGLTKIYRGGQSPALHALDLTVSEGEILGLLGPNGAGKTTVVSILSTLLRPTSGEATIDGWDILSQTHEVRRRIGVVPQRIALYGRLTAMENLAYFAKMQGLRKTLVKEAVRSGLALAGLENRSRVQVRTLSGGMQRRLNLAVGLLHRPRLLLLDEPTVGVDAQSRQLIFDNLRHSVGQGLAIIYTTHYMEEAATLCSRIAIMDEGRVITQGSCDQLLQNEPECANLADLFLKQTGRRLRD